MERLPVATLPISLRSIYKFHSFNLVQSACFPIVFETSDNFVLSSPTGSGKTVIFELAICRLIIASPSLNFKVIYQAPIKALCSERYADWKTRFSSLGLKVSELTGDSPNLHLADVQTAHIIITTPEKWDSTTRKWKDHRKFMENVRLFLIDEVHVLREDRGANLEAVVSRMKSIGSDVRFIALSASVPNLEDIATWLGKSSSIKYQPASMQIFDESYRPVKLEKHIYGYACRSPNEFQFDQVCNKNLINVITRHTAGRPILVFCMTRKSAESTANDLCIWWQSARPEERHWVEPSQHIRVENKDLQSVVASGVAFHHAGVGIKDRQAVQQAYIDGNISIICCTSTLAVGINLPAHFVIVKNTVTWQHEAGSVELSDLEVMQMLGRAGRPQFDRTAIAVIMTRAEKVDRYNKMVTGSEILESRLSSNLVEHMNSEIGLGTIRDAFSATKWLESTFLWIRLKKNPEHYQIGAYAPSHSPEAWARRICSEALDALFQHDLIKNDVRVCCTERGQAMARYHVQFETMKIFGAIQPKARMSELLSAIAQASEFKSLRLRGDQKSLYNGINQSPLLKWRIPVEISQTGHKVSLIIQATLGGVEIAQEARFKLQASQFNLDRTFVFQHASRLINCIVECELSRGDSLTVKNAMELARSLGARVWDDSPLQLGQIHGIGPVSMRKLVHANVKSIEDLQNTEAYKIEMVLSRNPPFGRDTLLKLSRFPKTRISISMVGEPTKCHGREGVEVNIDAYVGFLNEEIPTRFGDKDVYMSLLAEDSAGRVLHYQRKSASNIGEGDHILFQAHLTSHLQLITCYVSCENIAGTLQYATLNPKISASMFKPHKRAQPEGVSRLSKRVATWDASAIARQKPKHKRDDTFLYDELCDEELLGVFSSSDFPDIDTIPISTSTNSHSRTPVASRKTEGQPQRLPNGRWACNHSCKDKNACKHVCCKVGLEKKPAKPRSRKRPIEQDSMQSSTLTSSIPARKGLSEMSSTSWASQPNSSLRTPVSSSTGQNRFLHLRSNGLSTTMPSSGDMLWEAGEAMAPLQNGKENVDVNMLNLTNDNTTIRPDEGWGSNHIEYWSAKKLGTGDGAFSALPPAPPTRSRGSDSEMSLARFDKSLSIPLGLSSERVSPEQGDTLFQPASEGVDRFSAQLNSDIDGEDFPSWMRSEDHALTKELSPEEAMPVTKDHIITERIVECRKKSGLADPDSKDDWVLQEFGNFVELVD